MRKEFALAVAACGIALATITPATAASLPLGSAALEGKALAATEGMTESVRYRWRGAYWRGYPRLYRRHLYRPYYYPYYAGAYAYGYAPYYYRPRLYRRPHVRIYLSF